MALGYSLSASDQTSQTAEGKQQTASGTGYRGAQISLAVGPGASAKADGSASDTPQWMLWAGAAAVGYLLLKKKG